MLQARMLKARALRVAGSVCVVSTLAILALGCSPPAEQPPAAEQQPAAPTVDRQAEFGRFPDRPFVRVSLDKFQWRPTEGNTLGVETAILEGDPSKPGFYLTINKFPPGVMSRPHSHPEERNVTVIKGTWYTGDTKEFTPERTIPLKPGEYMRHPAGGVHYDGALDEETWVAISGYGPSAATVLDGGELFGKSR
jgi:quercetin dioxygenase-like cupin family protein